MWRFSRGRGYSVAGRRHVVHRPDPDRAGELGAGVTRTRQSACGNPRCMDPTPSAGPTRAGRSNRLWPAVEHMHRAGMRWAALAEVPDYPAHLHGRGQAAATHAGT